eukprot:Gb_11689 [translate_table: standard]
MGILDDFRECPEDQSLIILRPSIAIPLDGKEALCSRFSPDGAWLAVGNISGTIEVYNTTNDAGGQVHHWHATSGKHLNTVKELGNEINSVDYHPTNVKFATGGSDFKALVVAMEEVVLDCSKSSIL